MNRLSYFVVFLVLSFVSYLFPQDTFTRDFEIPTLNYEVGGFGNIISGVDFDEDGMPEIYLCNTNMIDRCDELIPRLYKFEWNGVTWENVWMTTGPVIRQNTWPAMTWGDLDKDGKPEIYWGPVNFTNPPSNLACPQDPNPNPDRILVYEAVGDGTDNMGVYDGFGGWSPNAKWTITDQDGVNLAIIKFEVDDIDSDGTDELIFCERGNSYQYGVLSISDVPDNENVTATWTLEASGLGDPILDASGSKYDFVIVNNYIYLFNSNGSVYPVKYDNGTWTSLPVLTNVADSYGSFKGAVTADLNNDGTDEIVLGGWDDPTKVYVLKQNGDSLLTYDVTDNAINVHTLNGAAVGDLDADGHPDFVFGTRNSVATSPNNAILRIEFQGGDFTDPANYVTSIIDSLLVPEPDGQGGQMDVISIGNTDGDPADEVVYTQGYTRSVANDTTANVAILDITFTPVSVEKENDLVPNQFYVDQNYPNPFNPSTEIRFGIIEASNIDLRIYDALGREVAVLINNQFMGAGSYNVKFNASNLASGTYIYRITTDKNTVSKKMQLLK